MVMDSLRYWVDCTSVDGFRFDLGTILARESDGFNNESGFMKACSQDPLLSTVKLIAEPWDCATRWAASLRAGPSGTIGFGTRSETFGATKHQYQPSQKDLPVQVQSSIVQEENRGPR